MRFLPFASLFVAGISVPLLEFFPSTYRALEDHRKDTSVNVPTKSPIDSFAEPLIRKPISSDFPLSTITTSATPDPFPTHLALRHVRRTLAIGQDSISSFSTVATVAATASILAVPSGTVTAAAATGTITGIHKHHHKHHHHGHKHKHPHKHHHHHHSYGANSTETALSMSSVMTSISALPSMGASSSLSAANTSGPGAVVTATVTVIG